MSWRSFHTRRAATACPESSTSAVDVLVFVAFSTRRAVELDAVVRDPRDALVEVDVRPAEPAEFTTPQRRVQCDLECRAEAVLVRDLEERRDLGRLPDRLLAPLDGRTPPPLGRR